MQTQESLDKWISKSIQYYNNHSIKQINMKTTEERIEQLEKAHSRLHNQMKDVLMDLIQVKDRTDNSYLELSIKLDNILNTLQPTEVAALPEELKNGKEYKAEVAEIVKHKDVKWQNMDYTNWEIRLVGKEEYVYIAFIPTGNTINTGSKVRFTYAAPFQCKKLKVI